MSTYNLFFLFTAGMSQPFLKLHVLWSIMLRIGVRAKIVFKLCHEKTDISYMQKQMRRSASQ